MAIGHFEELASRVAWAADGRQLDAVASLLWQSHGGGYLTDQQAEELDARIRAARTKPAGFVTALGSAALTAAGAAKRARRVKSADTRDRMRSMAYGGWLPRALAARFTIGELAVLSVVASEVAARGFCDLHVGTIAYRAGVSVRTVRNARHVAVELGLLTCHQRGTSKNGLANVLRIVSREWLAWLAKRAPAKGGKVFPPCHTGREETGSSGLSSGDRIAPQPSRRGGTPGLDGYRRGAASGARS